MDMWCNASHRPYKMQRVFFLFKKSEIREISGSTWPEKKNIGISTASIKSLNFTGIFFFFYEALLT